MSLFSRAKANTFSLAGLRLPTNRSRGILNGNTEPFGAFSEEEIKFRAGRGGKRGGASWYGGRTGRRRIIKLFLLLLVASVRPLLRSSTSHSSRMIVDIDILLFVRITRRTTTLFKGLDSTHHLADAAPLVDVLRFRYDSRFGVQHHPHLVALLHRITLRDRNATREGLFRLCEYDTAKSVGRNDLGGTYGVSYVLEGGSTTVGKTTNLPPPIDPRNARSRKHLSNPLDERRNDSAHPRLSPHRSARDIVR